MNSSPKIRILTQMAAKRMLFRVARGHEPSLSDLFSMLIYRFESKNLSIPLPGQRLGNMGNDSAVYAPFFSRERIFKIVEALKSGEAPPSVFAAIQKELDSTLSGIACWSWRSVGPWFKADVIDCFDLESVLRIHPPYTSQIELILKAKLSLEALLTAPLATPPEQPAPKKSRKVRKYYWPYEFLNKKSSVKKSR